MYEVTGDNCKAYFSTQGGVCELVAGDTVQINGMYGSKLGLQHGQPVSSVCRLSNTCQDTDCDRKYRNTRFQGKIQKKR